jgi:GxxExxY protein
MYADPTPIAADIDRDRLDSLSSQIIGAAHRVSSNLGYGFLEKVYENSLLIELESKGLFVEQQRPVQVFYQGRVVGDYIPDLVVEGSILIEVKAVTALDRVHRQQCISYLRATGYRVCLLLNFGQARFEMKRLVWRF